MTRSRPTAQRPIRQANLGQLPLFVGTIAQMIEGQERAFVQSRALGDYDEFYAHSRIMALREEVISAADTIYLQQPSTAREYLEEAERGVAVNLSHLRAWQTAIALGVGDRVPDLIRQDNSGSKKVINFPQAPRIL